MQKNILSSSLERLSEWLSIIGQPVRTQILLAIRHQPACVCHLEAALGQRQASISQHLMTLRKAGLVETIREGRHIFYKLINPQVIDLLEQFAVGSREDLFSLSQSPVPGCSCPRCNPGIGPELSCKKIPS